MKVEMKEMPSMPEMDKDTGVKYNPPKWYDCLLREDAAHSAMLATDSMMSKELPFPALRNLR